MKRGPKPRPPHMCRMRQALDLALSGLTPEQVAREMGIKRQTAIQQVAKAKHIWPAKTPATWPTHGWTVGGTMKARAAVILSNAGWPPEDIARATKAKLDSVRRWVQIDQGSSDSATSTSAHSTSTGPSSANSSSADAPDSQI